MNHHAVTAAGTTAKTAGLLPRLLLAVVLALFPLLAAPPAARADAPVEVVVEDTAGALYLPQLKPALAGISFYQPTKVVVFTRAGRSSDDLNEEVLRFARAEHPEWISADGQKWADGLFVFALDTTGRQIGTYFGEDRKVPLSEQEAIQEDTKELFRSAQWTDGTIAGVKSAASRIGRPWYLHPGTLWTGGIAALATLAGFGIRAGIRAGNRSKFAEALDAGDRSYASVTLRLEETELNASTIPPASTYGALVLERWHTLAARLLEMTKLRERLEAMGPKERSVKANVEQAREFQQVTADLDDLDDAIADSNALLNLHSMWREAWRNQSGDLARELAGMDGMLAGSKTEGSPETAAALRAHAAAALQRIAGLEAGLDSGTATPDAALDGLKAEREKTAELLEKHADAVIAAHTRSDREAELMRDKINEAAEGQRQHRRYGGSIVDIAYPRLPFISVTGFSSGVEAGQDAVTSARSAASSSGSSTGYGSSGGSFSGSGSSSRF